MLLAGLLVARLAPGLFSVLLGARADDLFDGADLLDGGLADDFDQAVEVEGGVELVALLLLRPLLEDGAEGVGDLLLLLLHLSERRLLLELLVSGHVEAFLLQVPFRRVHEGLVGGGLLEGGDHLGVIGLLLERQFGQSDHF